MTTHIPKVSGRWLWLWAVVCLMALPSVAPAFPPAKTKIKLRLSADTAQPGETIWAGLQMDMPPGWHTYWRNGGDAGQPTEISWKLPLDVSAGDIQWPVPLKDADTAGDSTLYTYVYKNEVVLVVPLTIAKSAPTGSMTITANAKWMECADICVPTGAAASATLNIGAAAKPSTNAALINQWRAKIPQRDTTAEAAAYWETDSPKTNSRAVVIEWKTNAAHADFFPYGDTNFDLGGLTEMLPATNGLVRLRKVIQTNDTHWPTELDGVLAAQTSSGDWAGVEEHLTIQSARAGMAMANVPAPTTSASLIVMLCLAFVGGLILNVMPCVLPVIALKVLGFVNQAHEEPKRVRQLGAVYGVGVLASFLVLAGLAIGVQRAGGVANWGDAFRNPQFQIIMTVLMTLIALNLFGVFEITLSGKAMGAASELSGRTGFSGAFFNGILATVLATPCTAPFLGIALAFAFSQSPFVIILVFLAAGLGLAFPFVAICLNPRLLKFLPKPGLWMEKFKNAMGFPMLATAVWLLWVSSRREDDTLWLGLFLVLVALVAWIWGQFVQRGRRRKGLAIVICLLLLGLGYEGILEAELQWRLPPQSKLAGIDWQVWSPAAVEAARRAGHPALVDFTAKSCLTCKLNLASSIDIDSTRKKLKGIGAVAFKADDTIEDPVIAQELQKYHASGVPLVLVFSKNVDQPAQVLPTILTPSTVADALDKAAK